MQRLFEQREFLFYWILLLSIFLSILPFFGKVFKSTATLIHELGHALFTLLTAGKVHKIELFHNTEGTTLTQNSWWGSRFLTSLAGYPLTALAGYGGLYLIHLQKEVSLLWTFGILTILSLILFIRNAYGIFWALSILISVGLLLYYPIPLLLFGSAVFISLLCLSEALISSFQLIRITAKNPKSRNDAKNLTDLTHLPALFWAIVFFSVSLFLCYRSIVDFFPNPFATF